MTAATGILKRMTGRDIALAAVVLSALITRTVLALVTRAVPDFSDMETYNLLALQGGISVVPPPGYPLFLRAVYTIFGARDYTAVFIVHGVVSSLTAGLIFLVTEKISNWRAAAVAGAAAVVFPNFLVYNLTTMSETLGLFLTMLLFWLLVSGRGGRFKAVAGAVLLIGACAVRPVMIYFWPGMLASLKKRFLFIAATVLLLSPWIIYSASTGRVTNRPGRAFYRTYNEKSNGKQYVPFSETALSDETLPNSVYFGEAFDFIAHNGWKTINIIYNKTAMIFSRGWDQHFMQHVVKPGSFAGFIMMYAFVPFMVLGMAGMVMYADGRNRVLILLLASYLAAFVLFAIFKVRYRFLVEPVFIIFTAIFLDRALLERFAAEEPRRRDPGPGRWSAGSAARIAEPPTGGAGERPHEPEAGDG